MSMQKFANEIKNNPDKKLKVFPSGKTIVAGLALGAATMAMGGMPNMVEATDGHPGAQAVDINLAHMAGAVITAGALGLAMKEGFEYDTNKTKKISIEEMRAAQANRGR